MKDTLSGAAHTATRRTPPPETKAFTVVGFNGETRFAETYEIPTASAAETAALQAHPDLKIAGTFIGTICPVL